MKDRFLNSPTALGLVGGAVGAIAGKMIGDRTRARHGRRELQSGGYRGGYAANERGYRSEYYGRDYETRNWDVPYDEYTATHPTVTSETIITEDPMYGLDTGERGDRMEGIRESGEPSGGGLKEKAGELKGKASEKFSDVKDRARSAASNVRGHMPSGDAVRHRAGAIRDKVPSREQFRSGARRMNSSLHDRPEIWGLAAVVAGAVFGALMPLSGRERSVLGPVKSDAKGRVRAAADELTQRAESFKEGVKEGLTEEGGGESGGESGGYGGDYDTRYHADTSLGGSGYHASEYSGGGTGYSAGSSDEKSLGSPDTDSGIASHDTGAVGGYGSDSGFTAGSESTGGSQTYSAGSSEDETRREGYNPIPDPDVTRH